MHTVLSSKDTVADCIVSAADNTHEDHNLKEKFVDHSSTAVKETYEEFATTDNVNETDKDYVVPPVKKKDVPAENEEYTVAAEKETYWNLTKEDCTVPNSKETNCKESLRDQVYC